MATHFCFLHCDRLNEEESFAIKTNFEIVLKTFTFDFETVEVGERILSGNVPTYVVINSCRKKTGKVKK